MATTPQPHGNWVVRRRIMVAVVAFCMGTIAYTLVYSGRTDRVAETALTMSFAIIGTTVGTYVGGAVLEKGKK